MVPQSGSNGPYDPFIGIERGKHAAFETIPQASGFAPACAFPEDQLLQFLYHREEFQFGFDPTGTVGKRIDRLENAREAAETVVTAQNFSFNRCRQTVFLLDRKQGADGFDVAPERLFLVVCHTFYV